MPPLISGCVFWVRPDLGLSLGTGSNVSSWNDQSGTNDSNKNLTVGATAPTFTPQDSNYNQQPTVQFGTASNCYFASGTWASSLSQAFTAVAVAHKLSGAPYEWLFDNSGASGGHIGAGQTSSTANTVSMWAGLNNLNYSTAWPNPTAFLGEFNHGSSALYFGNFTSPQATAGGTDIGSDFLTALTLGNYGAQGAAWDGTIAEFIIYNRLLTASEKGRLRLYLSSRYGIAIG